MCVECLTYLKCYFFRYWYIHLFSRLLCSGQYYRHEYIEIYWTFLWFHSLEKKNEILTNTAHHFVHLTTWFILTKPIKQRIGHKLIFKIKTQIRLVRNYITIYIYNFTYLLYKLLYVRMIQYCRYSYQKAHSTRDQLAFEPGTL